MVALSQQTIEEVQRKVSEREIRREDKSSQVGR